MSPNPESNNSTTPSQNKLLMVIQLLVM